MSSELNPALAPLMGARLATHRGCLPGVFGGRFGPWALCRAVGIVADLARLTENVTASKRRYSGVLATTKAPASLWRQISAINNDEFTERQLVKTILSWVLTLDEENRPESFELSWHFLLDDGTRLTSPFETRYSRWREGRVSEPG